MKNTKTFIIILLITTQASASPKIGIITVPPTKKLLPLIKKSLEKKYPKIFLKKDILKIMQNLTYFPKSYKKWLKSQKIDSIAISIYNPNLLNYIKKLDGVILIGGNIDLIKDNFVKIDSDDKILRVTGFSEFSLKTKEILELVKMLNREKVFPLFGICLGFQEILLIENDLELELNFMKNLNHFSNLEIWGKKVIF